MPRGRGIRTPEEAKNDSLRTILKSLQGSGEGKRFSDLKAETGFHQSTLSARLKDLISLGYVDYDPIKHVYQISQGGCDDYETRELVNIIERSSRLILGSTGGGAIYPDEDLIIKSSVAYSYPAVNISHLGYLKRIIHKYFMLHTIHDLARRRLIDPRCLTGEKPLIDLVDQLKANLNDRKQVLAFTVDMGKVSELMSIGYLEEVVRVAEAEDMYRIQSPHSEWLGYGTLWRRYALQLRALEYIEEHGRTSLSQLGKIMEVGEAEAESILDRLTVRDPVRAEMMIFDEAGNYVRSVELGSTDKEIKIHGGAVIKIGARSATNMPLLKSTDDEGVFYEILKLKRAG